MIHLGNDHPTYGRIPLCGRGMWDELTNDPEVNDCTECASIAGTYSTRMQEFFSITADGSEVITCHTCGTRTDEYNVDRMCPECQTEQEAT